MKRIITLLASAALVASGLFIQPAAAAPDIPSVVNIDDPAGDANTQSGDQALPTGNVSNVGDILKVWFSNDPDKVNVHFQTSVKPPATAYGFDYRVEAMPGADGNCLRFRTLIPSGALVGGTTMAKVFDMCNDGANWFNNGVEGEVVIEDGPDGTGITTMTFDRSTLPDMFGEGATLSAPAAWSYAAVGAADAGFQSIRIDDTKVGLDYAFVDGDPAGTPPGKNDPPGKKKGCAKGKGKKRGCEGKGKKAPKPGKPAAECAPYEPGDAGKDAETLTVTDEATEEKPLEQAIEFGSAVPFATSDTHLLNLQVDSAAADAGLYAYIEFTPRNDYDLNLMYPDGSYGAQSHALNPLIEINEVEFPVLGKVSSTGHGGESTDHSEKLVGIRTADCGGWTLDVTNWAGPGEEVTLQLWLGEAKNDPSPQGEVT